MDDFISKNSKQTAVFALSKDKSELFSRSSGYSKKPLIPQVHKKYLDLTTEL